MPNAADYFDAMRAMQSCASLKTLDFALLPPSAQELARVLGLPAALKMVDMYGGLTLRIPHGETPQGRAMLDDIAKHIGESSSRSLAVECQHVVHPPSLEAGGFLPRAECGRKKL